MSRVLMVDDEQGVLYAMGLALRAGGHVTIAASSGREALSRLDEADVVVADYAMPGMSGLELLHAVQEHDRSIPVVIMTAQGSERLAVEAMKRGAYDYVPKPFELDAMRLVVERALEARTLRTQNRRLAAERAVGRAVAAASPAMRRLLDTIGRIGPRDITVLVRGETGAGKEIVSSLIHAESARARQPLVRFNCAAIPGELAEAELFGHVRGAFTGAAQSRRGFFAEAQGGTLVLDEIGELTPSVQPKLLRALQDGEIQPVGSGHVERLDVRLIACTNRDLMDEVRAGRFREDLYYRLAVVELVVPPLRDRREDIPLLAADFARHYAERYGAEPVRLAPELLDHLRAAPWPGNVRQLENTIARVVAYSGGGEVGLDTLSQSSNAPAPGEERPNGGATLRDRVEAFERQLIIEKLEATRGNQSEAARQLGLSRSAFVDRLRKYGLNVGEA